LEVGPPVLVGGKVALGGAAVGGVVVGGAVVGGGTVGVGVGNGGRDGNGGGVGVAVGGVTAPAREARADIQIRQMTARMVTANVVFLKVFKAYPP